MTRSEVEEALQDENPNALFADGFDDAIIGVAYQFTRPPLVAYDYVKCIKELMSQDMSEDEAEDFMSFNVLGACVGEGTPIFIWTNGD